MIKKNIPYHQSIVISLLVISLLTINTPVTKASTHNYSFGLSVGETMLGLSTTQLNAEMDDMNSLGIGWLRIDIDWSHIQPDNSSTYWWGNIDRFVAAAKSHGIQVFAILDNTPAWARPPGCTSSRCRPNNPQQFATFAKAAVARYAPQGVRDWEIWNEPNLNGGWQPGANAQQYVALLKATTPAIRSTGQAVGILAGALAPSATENGNIAPITFLQQVYAYGGKNYFNAVTMHPYSFPAMPGYYQTWNAWSQMYLTPASLRSVMVQNGDSGKRIWITEYGAPTGGPGILETSSTDTTFAGSPDHVTETLQAQMLTQAVTIHKQYSWMGPLFFYSYKDLGTSQSSIENFFGLLRYDGSRKPAYAALKSAIAI